MVGTSMDTMGGISTVIKGYVAGGLFDRVPMVYVITHRDGNVLTKLGAAIVGYLNAVKALVLNKVRVVHMHFSSRASFWRKLPIFALYKIAGKPVLLHLHGSEFMDFYHQECGPIRRRIVETVFSRADSAVALSPQWADNIRDISPEARVEVIFNGVPVGDQVPDRSTREQVPVILFLGRLGRRKGIYDLLDALAQIAERGIQFELIAAGDGETRECAAQARQLGIESSVLIPGWIEDEKKQQLLSQADIFVLPSHAEGLPMSLLEALAAGLPVVCSSAGGMPTAVSNEVEGFIIKPGDVDALAESLVSLLTDPGLRQRMGRDAFQKAKNVFDVQLSINRFIELYESHGLK
jgi:glycosyltransferase involved in cell wall biosynthesis